MNGCVTNTCWRGIWAHKQQIWGRTALNHYKLLYYPSIVSAWWLPVFVLIVHPFWQGDPRPHPIRLHDVVRRVQPLTSHATCMDLINK
jgi:hypothetical protein